jgi:leader peptidase (prepilin peptidase) / N-methyltransferase
MSADPAPMRARLRAHRWALAAMVGAVGVSLYALTPPVSLFAAVLGVIAIFIAAVDLDYLVIPDAANGAVVMLGFVLVVMEAPPGSYLAALADALGRCVAAGGALVLLRFLYFRRAGVEGLGLGDVKLAAAGAPFLAWPTLPIALLIASLGGLLAVATRGVNARKMPDRAAEIPFGAFLAPAIWLAFMLERSGVLAF